MRIPSRSRPPVAVLALFVAGLFAAGYYLAPPLLSADEFRAFPGGAEAAAAQERTDSADVAAVLDRFHTALATGDSATVVDLLAPDALILEGGGVETREEYRAHHLPADIAFARAVQRERGPIRVRIQGEEAWAVTTSTTRGTYQERRIDSEGAELALLTRTPDGWKITAIHWSSRARGP